MECEGCSAKCGARRVQCEVWSVKFEVKCGVRRVQCEVEVWSVKCGVCGECSEKCEVRSGASNVT